jgi:hypothetical protein
MYRETTPRPGQSRRASATSISTGAQKKKPLLVGRRALYSCRPRSGRRVTSGQATLPCIARGRRSTPVAELNRSRSGQGVVEVSRSDNFHSRAFRPEATIAARRQRVSIFCSATHHGDRPLQRPRRPARRPPLRRTASEGGEAYSHRSMTGVTRGALARLDRLSRRHLKRMEPGEDRLLRQSGTSGSSPLSPSFLRRVRARGSSNPASSCRVPGRVATHPPI